MDKELRKLSRMELLDLLLIQSREIDRLNAEVEQLRTDTQTSARQVWEVIRREMYNPQWITPSGKKTHSSLTSN